MDIPWLIIISLGLFTWMLNGKNLAKKAYELDMLSSNC
jgi:hypothetical protein